MYTIDLGGRVAIVTGARRGIGRRTALTLAEAGAHVVANSRDFSNGGEELVAEIEKKGLPRAILAEGSVSEKKDVQRVVEAALSEFGRIDFLVNNAAITERRPFLEIGRDEWDKILAVNLTGVLLFSQAVAPHMIRQGSGRIVNISSIAGLRGSAFFAHYAASKGALINLTKTLAKELGRHGVLVNAVAPGRIVTDLLMKTAEGEEARWLRETRLGRLGTADEVANVVLFLVSNLSTYVTGETIEVSGGVVMG